MRAKRPTLLAISWRMIRFVIHLAYGAMLGLIYPALRHSRKMQLMQHWNQDLLSILNVQLQTRSFLMNGTRPCGMLVANHISWLDIIALNAASPGSFVAKSELRSWPLVGWLCWRVSTLFINREDSRDAIRINRQISVRLRAGENIIFFPEGTTTAGTLPGHFHSSLLQSAIDCQIDIHPIAIRYHDAHGFQTHDADFTGNMGFVPSLWRVLSSPSLNLTLTRLPALSSAGETRRRLAREAHAAICTSLNHPDLTLHPLPTSYPCRDESEPASSLYALMLPGRMATTKHLERLEKP